jgi:TetR/AcrR family transcriptional regulator, cholesterol catabolism regulator
MRSKDASTRDSSKSPKKESRGRSREIYRAAAEVFVVKGFDGTSMNDIARAVDLTKAGLYHYISGKQDLLHAIMDFAMDTIETEVIEPCCAIDDPEQRLRTILANHINLLTKHGTHVSILTDEVSALVPAHREHIIGRKRAYLEFLRETLQEMKDAGRMRDLNMNIAALNILSTVVGMARWYNPDGGLTIEEVKEQTIELVLGGVLVGR